MPDIHSICGEESVIAKINGVIKLISLEDLYNQVAGEEVENNDLTMWSKTPEDLYVLDRGTNWTKVSSLKRHELPPRSLFFTKIEGTDSVITTGNYPIIISNDPEDTQEVRYLGAIRRLFRDGQLLTRDFAGEIDHIKVDFMDHCVPDGYCFNDYKGFYHTCHHNIDLAESAKISLLGYFVGLFILDGNFLYNQRNELIGVEVPCEHGELTANIARGVYKATGIALEILPGADQEEQDVLYTENVAMLKLMQDVFKLKENTLERKLPEDVLRYPKEFQLGIVSAFLGGKPERYYNVGRTYKKHGRKLSNQFAILARITGVEGRTAFREGNHPAEYPRCGYIVNWNRRAFYCDIKDEWRQLVKVSTLSNRTFVERNRYGYSVKTESHSLLVNNIWLHD